MHSNQKFGAVISCCSIHFLLTKLREKKHNEENSLPFLRCVSGSIRYIFLLRLSVMLRVSSMIRNPVGRLRRRKSSNLFTSAMWPQSPLCGHVFYIRGKKDVIFPLSCVSGPLTGLLRPFFDSIYIKYCFFLLIRKGALPCRRCV